MQKKMKGCQNGSITMINELIRFSRAYGRLKYFHPTDIMSDGPFNEACELIIREILEGKSFNVCWEKYLKPFIVFDMNATESNMVVWQHLGVDTKHPFYAKRIPEFISVRSNRTAMSKIPLNRVQLEIPGNFKGKKLTINFEGDSLPFLLGLDENAEIMDIAENDQQYFINSNTVSLVIGFNLVGEECCVKCFNLHDEDGEVFSWDQGDGAETWSFSTSCYHWSEQNKTFICSSKKLIPSQIISDMPNVNEQFQLEIDYEKFVDIPLCLSCENAKWTQKQKDFQKVITSQYKEIKDNELVELRKVFDLIIFWNAIHLFHPYPEKLTHWDAGFETALSNALNGIDHSENLLTFGSLLNDGHFFPRFSDDLFCSDFSFVYFKDKVFLANVCEGEFQGDEGKEVVHVNGEAIESFLSEWKKKVSSSPQRKIHLALFKSLYRKKGEQFKIETVDGSVINGVCERPFPPKTQALPSSGILENDILYINLNLLSYEEILKNLENRTIKGVIFDNRLYPKANHIILSHFMKSDLTSKVWLQKPEYVRPRNDEKISDGYVVNGWSIKPRLPFFDIPHCLLIDLTTQSYGESLTTIYQSINPDGIIGRPTSGANGDINFMLLPSGATISWSCRKVLDHFGNNYFAQGISPAIEVDEFNKSESICFDKDSFVQAGIAYLRGKIG